MSNDFPNRQSIRLKNYDYACNGLYFVTICTKNHGNLFGEIANGKMALNEIGIIVEKEWFELTTRFNHIKLHEFIVMTNHIHGIIEIVGAGFTSARICDNARKSDIDHQSEITRQQIYTTQPDNDQQSENTIQSDNDVMDRAEVNPAPTIGDMVCAYKSIVAKLCLKIYKSENKKMGKMWQRNYHEHIIRNEKSYQLIAEYIQNNPAQWKHDKFYRE